MKVEVKSERDMEMVEGEETEAQRRSKAYLDGWFDGLEEARHSQLWRVRLRRWLTQ